MTRVVLPLALVAMLLPTMTGAQPASLVHDFEPQFEIFQFETLGALTPAGNRLVFLARQPDLGGLVVWATDGTSAGTLPLVDLCPGHCDPELRMLGSTGPVALWLSEPGISGSATLWRSDGTRPGTFALSGSGTLPLDVPLHGPAAILGGRLLFTGCDDTACRPWATDGTPGATRVLADIALHFFFSEGDQMVVAGDVAFLVAGNELWVSDGTPGGTRRLASFAKGPRLPAAAEDLLFFVAEGTTGDGEELWVSDGTAEGTRAVSRFSVPQPFEETRLISTSDRLAHVVAFEDRQGFEVWESDGTPDGTRRLTAFDFNRAVLGDSRIAAVGGRIVFPATDGTGQFRLWSVDGRRIAPLSDQPVPAVIELTAVGSAVLFAPGFIPGLGDEPWATDGTPEGTRPFDLCPGPCGGAVSGIVWLGHEAFFAASNGLWRTDGRRTGTRRLLDLPGNDGARPALARTAGRLFVARRNERDDHKGELWVLAGSSPPGRLVTRLGSGGSGDPGRLAPFGDRLFFTACEDIQRHLWLTDPTSSVRRVTDDARGGGCGSDFEEIEEVVVVGDRLFFLRNAFSDHELATVAADGSDLRSLGTFQGFEAFPTARLLVEHRGRLIFLQKAPGADSTELWESDGTVAGTRRVFSLPLTFVPALRSHAGTLYLIGTDAEGSLGLWASDGTAGGTRRLAVYEREFFEPSTFELESLGSLTFFAAGDEERGVELWRTDGTAAGTVRVTDIAAGSDNSEPAELTHFRGRLCFSARAGAGRGLFCTDGTSEGTVLLWGSSGSRDIPHSLTVAGDLLFFVGDDGVHGWELFVSDGTAAGTRLVRDIAPGPAWSVPQWLTAFDGRLWFAAHEPLHGAELWTSDGTEAGTRLAHDVAPGAPSSFPERLTAAGPRLYFSAEDGLSGRELWSLAAGPACTPGPNALCLGGRYRVEVAWRDFAERRGRGTARPLTADTGAFWFFEEANLELLVKVLDGRGTNGHVWTFYGSLSNVEYQVTVTDAETGLTRRYFNPSGQFASVGDTESFGRLGASAGAPAVVPPPAPLPVAATGRAPAGATAPCEPGPRRLCLNGGRFAVEAAWRDFGGDQGAGTALGLTGDTGAFWFFDEANVELVVKVLDGREVNGRFWVFYGALSNVEYTLTVTDTATGAVRTYRNPSGRFASAGDTEAFAP